MTTPKPPPRTLPAATERKIQQFLERVASIVLENPQLSSERLERLSAVADELELTAEEFRSTLDDLLKRGVIKRMEVVPPKPPPLPGKHSTSSSADQRIQREDFALTVLNEPPVQAPGGGHADDDEIEGREELDPDRVESPARGVSVTAEVKPPAAQKPLPETGAVKPDADKVHGGRVVPKPAIKKPPVVERPQTIPVESESADGPAAASVPNGAATLTPGKARVQEQFLDRAEAILAEFQGWNPKSQALISAVARDLGLSDSAVQEALQKLRRPEPPPSSSDSSIQKEKLDSSRWRVEGEPPPVPPPPPQTPAETFRDFARPSLAAVRDGIVSESLEQRLLAHGTRVLGLSAVYARHLLADLVAERRMRFASVSDLPPAEADDSALDPKLQDFLRVAAPVLAQHRGLNPQSRMLLTALARERELTESEMDRAIASMNSRAPVDSLSRIQQERVTAYRAFLDSQLKKVGRSILTPALTDKFLVFGVESHGLEPELATSTLRDVAGTLSVAVITHEQAEQHLRDLLSELLPLGAKATPMQRERIELEGAQWGLPSSKITELLQSHLVQNEKRLRREERITKWALISAVTAAVIVVGFLVWAVASRGQRRTTPDTVTLDPIEPTAPSADVPPSEPSWLESNADLAIAVVNARSDFPTLRRTLNDLSSNEPDRRTVAYKALIKQMKTDAGEEPRRNELSKLLSLALAVEPSEIAAEEITDSLVQGIPTAVDSEWTVADVPEMYRAVRTVAASLQHVPDDSSRSRQINAVLQRSTGSAVVSSDPDAVAACLRGLSERLFRLLTAEAAKPRVDLRDRHEAVDGAAAEHIKPESRTRWNAELTAAVLTHAPTLWPKWETPAREAISSKDPLAILELLDVYEATADINLRSGLYERMVAEFPGTPNGDKPDEVAAFVRQSLGIRDADDPEGLYRKLERETAAVFKSPWPPSDPPGPFLTEILRTAHYSTLVCAFAANEWSNTAVAELRKSGPKSATPPAKPSDEEPEAPTPEDMKSKSLDLRTREALHVLTTQISDRRAAPTQRLGALDSLGRVAARISDLPPDVSAVVANYLLLSKSNTEHERVVGSVPQLAGMNQLVLAIADRLDDASLTAPQMAQLLAAVVGSEVRLNDDKDREAARLRLIQLVVRRVAAEVPASDGAVPANHARSALAEYYLLQAKLLGVGIPEDVVQSGTPAAVVKRLIEEFPARFSGASLSAAQQADLARISHEVVAAEYSATNELEQLVLFERIWLKLLAIEANRRAADRQAEATELIQTIREQDRQATDVLTQLRDGHLALLKMWLLIAKRG